jgi:uncharacterized cupin superfamily protein
MTAATTTVPRLPDAAGLTPDDLADWGDVPEPLSEEVSHTSGKIMVGGGGVFPEAGYWRCTPGSWRCEVDRDEFCHFLEGDCVYTHDSGEVIPIKGGDTAWFPAGWNGRCEVRRTVAKVYLIR